ncbi:Uma2 family endonuclease [bacterium]|nr:Uma2 family endonuclease [bacterium]
MVKTPTVIIEVLSKGTEPYDRGFKLPNYQRMPSLEQYLIVSQEMVWIESYLRQQDGSWRYESFSDPEPLVSIPSLKVNMKVSEVYRRVKC